MPVAQYEFRTCLILSIAFYLGCILSSTRGLAQADAQDALPSVQAVKTDEQIELIKNEINRYVSNGGPEFEVIAYFKEGIKT